MSDNTRENVKRSQNLDQVETNPVDDVERLLQEIRTDGISGEKDKEDDTEDGNMTRLVDKIWEMNLEI